MAGNGSFCGVGNRNCGSPSLHRGDGLGFRTGLHWFNGFGLGERTESVFRSFFLGAAQLMISLCKVCSRQLTNGQKSACSHACRSIWVSSLIKGRPSPFKGIIGRFSDETRKKIGDAQRGKPKSEAFKAKLSAYRKTQPGFFKGKKHSPEFRELMRKVHGGAAHHNWKGGISPEHGRIRSSGQYAQWRKAVFERDNFTCVNCGMRGGDLNADHLKPFADYPELRFDLDNGRTLCIPCHKLTPSYGGKYKHMETP